MLTAYFFALSLKTVFGNFAWRSCPVSDPDPLDLIERIEIQRLKSGSLKPNVKN